MNNFNNIFEKIDNEVSAYILGYYWADGSLYKNTLELELQESDVDILNYFNKVICNNSRKIYYRFRHNSGTYRLLIVDKLISNSLRELGFKNKNERMIPKINEDMMVHFIRGYFDGDGCYMCRLKGSKKEYRADISGRKKFIELIEKFLPNFDSCEIVENKTCISKRIYYHGIESVSNFLNYLSKNSSIKLERKYPVLH